MKQRNPVARALGERAHGHRRWHLIGPLARFLRSRLGRPWSAVYSELCRSLPSGKVGVDLRALVHDCVTLRVERHGGVVYGLFDHGGPRPLYRGSGRRDFYVDPADGILREAPPPPHEPETPEPLTRIDRGRGLLYLKQGGIWFAARLRAVPDAQPPFDHWFRAAADSKNAGERRALYGRPRLYAACKRQLDRRALRRAGLENDR